MSGLPLPAADGEPLAWFRKAASHTIQQMQVRTHTCTNTTTHQASHTHAHAHAYTHIHTHPPTPTERGDTLSHRGIHCIWISLVNSTPALFGPCRGSRAPPLTAKLGGVSRRGFGLPPPCPILSHQRAAHAVLACCQRCTVPTQLCTRTLLHLCPLWPLRHTPVASNRLVRLVAHFRANFFVHGTPCTCRGQIPAGPPNPYTVANHRTQCPSVVLPHG